jgi:putative membrane protein
VSATDAWRRLDGRMLAIHGVRFAGSLAPIALVLALGRGTVDRTLTITLGALFAGAGFSAAAAALRWATTRYRVTGERIEIRSGLARRREQSIPRDRVRTVNVTAKPLHRLFGLATVEVGTGRAGQGRLTLDAVRAPEGPRLREELLAGSGGTVPAVPAAAPDGAPAGAGAQPLGAAEAPVGAGPDTTPAGTPAGPGAGTGAVPSDDPLPPRARPAGAGDALPLAALRWRWLPYHLLSPWTLALPVIVIGGAMQTLDSFGVEGAVQGAVTDGVDRAADAPLPATVALLLTVALAVGVLAASALFVESWWAYRLTRERGGTLHLRRGLLTARSLTIEQRRLRGVELGEPLPLRAAGGATLQAIVSGLRGSDEGTSARVDALLPAAPRADAEQVAAEVLRLPGAPARLDDLAAEVLRLPGVPAWLDDLAAHPRAALRRRLVRGAGAAATLTAALVLAGPLLGLVPGWTWVVGVAALPAGLLLGRDAHRALGHGIAGDHLLTRHGTFVRRTVALERDGVIGWTVARSPFQRRSGLVTLTATTAAGAGGYRVIDVTEAEGAAFAETAVPGVLAPFLQRDPIGTAPDHGPRLRSSTTTPATSR